MKYYFEACFIFLILLLGTAAYSLLGSNSRENFTSNAREDKPYVKNNFDHYNHYTGTSATLPQGSTFYGPENSPASIITNGDGSQSLKIKLPGDFTASTFTVSSVESYVNLEGPHFTATKFYGPNGATASIVNTDNGQQAIKVVTPSGTYYYNTREMNTQGSSADAGFADNSTQYYGSTGVHVQPTGVYAVTNPQGTTVIKGPGDLTAVQGPNGTTAVQGPAGNTVVQSSHANASLVTSGPSTIGDGYYDALPRGIPRSQIPPGQEDLYILKSEVVPPICPACPSAAMVPREKPCPACPPCARCPEPSFECKKVPNYSVQGPFGGSASADNFAMTGGHGSAFGVGSGSDFLPVPVLSDFSQFGM